MDTFDADTRNLINDVHRAWKSQASLSEYSILRDRIISRRDRLDVQITTLSTVVGLVVRKSPAYDQQEDLRWQEFFALASTSPPESIGDGDDAVSRESGGKRRPNRNDASRSRNLAIVVALWSAEIVQHYKWDRVGQRQMSVIRSCAVQYPDFEAGFVPLLNQVLLARHSAAILHCRERALNEVRLQPCKDFDIETIKSVNVDWNMQRMWETNQDGALPLDSYGTLLRDVRPQHFQVYLLQKDRYGTLEPRAFIDSCLENANTASQPVTSMGTFMSEGLPIPPRDEFTGSTTQSLSSTSLADTVLTDASLDWAAYIAQSSLPQASQNANDHSGLTLIPTPFWSPPELETQLTSHVPFNLDCLSPPSAALQNSWMDSDNSWISVPTPSSSLQSSSEPAASPMQLDETSNGTADGLLRKRLFEEGATVRNQRRSLTRRDSIVTNRNSRSRKDETHTHCGRAESTTRSLYGLHSPSISTMPGRGDSSLRELRVSSSTLASSDELTIEGRLHNKHRPELTKYTEWLAGMVDGGQRHTQSQWLTAHTLWATIWSSSKSLGSGRAASEHEADVIYCTATDIVAHAKAGKAIRKPMVIKEKFTDSGMHTVAQLLAQLQIPRDQPDLRSRTPRTQPPVPMEDNGCLHAASSQGIHTVVSFLPNMTRSHRPIFTMLPRFRLFETLTGARQWDANEQRVSFNLRAAFNTVSLSRSFSGPRVSALHGTWTRNLQGTSYFMIMPENEMASEWETFAIEADQWQPRGRGRLVVLEEEDVLLLPPGLRIVHAVLSPEDCLVEGGLLWDNLNVLEILHSMIWAYQNKFVIHRPFPDGLEGIVFRLKKLVFAQPDDFRGSLDRATFLGMFESAIKCLQDVIAAC